MLLPSWIVRLSLPDINCPHKGIACRKVIMQAAREFEPRGSVSDNRGGLTLAMLPRCRFAHNLAPCLLCYSIFMNLQERRTQRHARRLTCCFPRGGVASSCWKPKRRCYETKNGRPTGHVGVDGPQDSRCPGTAARLWNRAAHRADQRRSAGRESRDSVSRAVEAGARRRDRLRVGRLRK